MYELKYVINNYRRALCNVHDFFFFSCSHLDESNVHQVCSEVRDEDWLYFRRQVCFARVGDGPDNSLTNGIRVIREYFARQGTLLLGDYLLLEISHLEYEITRARNAKLDQRVIEFLAHKDLLESLQEIYPPYVLKEHSRTGK